MPAAVFFEGGRVPDNCTPTYASPDGAAAKIGGLVQAVPISGVLRPDVSLDEAVEHEIRAAKLAGIDGFQFFYPFSGRGLLTQYNRTISAFYRVAEEKFPDFRLTLCFCCSECDLEESNAIARWSESINEVVGRKTVLSVAGDEWITDKPYRTDRLAYGKSSLFDFYFKTLCGDAEPPVSLEYRE